MAKARLVDWIKEAGNGQDVEAVVIGEMGWGDYGSDRIPDYAACPKGKVMTWAEAAPFIGYEFDDGHGAPGCQAIYAWTKDRVIFISQYDGATSVEWVPRNPVDIMPSMPGG